MILLMKYDGAIQEILRVRIGGLNEFRWREKPGHSYVEDFLRRHFNADINREAGATKVEDNE